MTFLAHVGKDLRLLVRDRHALLVGLGLPVVILAAFAQLDLGSWVTGSGRDPEAFILVLAATFPGLLLASTSVLRERRAGTLHRLARTPASRAPIVASKVVAGLALIAVQVALLVGMSLLVLSADANQDPAGLALLLLLSGLAAHAMGLLIGALARSEAQALQLVAMVFLLMLTLSGFLRPLDSVGTVGRVASYSPMALGYRGTMLLFEGRPLPFYPLVLALATLALVALTTLATARRA